MRRSALSHQITGRRTECAVELRLTGQMPTVGSPFDKTRLLQVGHMDDYRSLGDTTLCHKIEHFAQKPRNRLFSDIAGKCQKPESFPTAFCPCGRHFDACDR